MTPNPTWFGRSSSVTGGLTYFKSLLMRAIGLTIAIGLVNLVLWWVDSPWRFGWYRQ